MAAATQKFRGALSVDLFHLNLLCASFVSPRLCGDKHANLASCRNSSL